MASDDEKMPDVDEVQDEPENEPEPDNDEPKRESEDEGEGDEDAKGDDKPEDEPEPEDEDQGEAEAEAAEPKHRFDDDDEDDDEYEQSGDEHPKAPPAPTPMKPKAATLGEGGSQSQSQSAPVQREAQRFTSRYERILGGQVVAAEEARSWLKRVLVDGPRAIADILAVVVSPAVWKGAEFMDDELITQATVMKNEPKSSVREVCAVLEKESQRVTGLLVTERRARYAFQEFWSRVASDSSDAVLYDTDCFDTLLSWLEEMSTAKLSILRHSACVAAYSLVDGLIETGSRLRSKLSTRQRQLDKEKLKCEKKAKKGAAVKYSTQYKRLSEEVEVMSANNGELVELADKVFTGIFVLKYKDVAPEIRVVSVEFLGRWIMKYPDHYLDDTHTKYVGWLLSDKKPAVRRACLAVLSDMLKEPEFFSSLELFLRRFLSRIVEMCRDKDTEVSIRAIRICALLIPYDILSHEACDQISDQMFDDSNVSVRKAAGEFVAALITDPDDDTPPIAKRKRGRKKPDPLSADIPETAKAKGLLRELMKVCIRDDGQQMESEAIVESIWDVMPAFRAWQAYAELLEEDDDDDSEDALPESHRALLCELLGHAAKIVVESEPEPQSKSNRRTAAEETCSDALARIFTPLIPKFLVQYQGSTRILAALVQIPIYFSEMHFREAAQKKHFLQLLHRLVNAISKNTASMEVLNAASSTFKTMVAEMHPLNELAKQALAKAATNTSKELRALVASGIEGSDAVKVEASVVKAKVISELMELPEGTYDDILAILDAIFEKELPVRFNTNIAINALFVATSSFTWDAVKASQILSNVTGQDRDTESDEAASKLKNTFDEVVRRLVRFSEYPFALRVRERAAVTISSILFLRRNIMRSLNLDLEENSEEGDSSTPLSDKAVTAVNTCLIDIIHAQWGLPLRHPKVTSRYENKRGKDADVQEQDVHSFLLSLIQLTMKSAVPDRFLHLPFLGLLLNRRRGDMDIMDLIKQFLKLKIEDKHGATYELARDALYTAGEIKGGARETKHFAVTQLARAFVEGVPDIRSSEPFFANVLQALVDKCRDSMGDEADVRNGISILGKANAFFATRVTTETAAPILTEMRKLRTDLRDTEDMDKSVREELSMLVSPVIQQLELFSSGDEQYRTTKSRRRLPRPLSKVGKGKRKKRSSDAIPWHGSGNVNVENSQGLRRSGRTRKPRNFGLFKTTGDEEEDEEDFQDMVDDEDAEGQQSQDDEEEQNEDEEDEGEHDVVEEEPPRTPVTRKKRRSNARTLEQDEAEEEESPVAGSKKKKRRSRAKDVDEEEEDRQEDHLQEEETPIRNRRKRKSDDRDGDVSEHSVTRSKRRRSSTTKEDVVNQVVGKESTKPSSGPKRRRSSRLQRSMDTESDKKSADAEDDAGDEQEEEQPEESGAEEDGDDVAEVKDKKANGRKQPSNEVLNVENNSEDDMEPSESKARVDRKRRASKDSTSDSDGVVKRKKRKRTW